MPCSFKVNFKVDGAQHKHTGVVVFLWCTVDCVPPTTSVVVTSPKLTLMATPNLVGHIL